MNPTGSVYRESELEALAQVLLRHPQVWVLSDDIYEHLLFTGERFATIAACSPALRPRVLTVNGVSKSYCMTGWRIGFGAGDRRLVRAMQTIQSQVISCPCSVSQAAAGAALDGPLDTVASLRDLFCARRDLVVGMLNGLDGLECPLPDGAFYAFPSCRNMLGTHRPDGSVIASDEDFAGWLVDAAGVVVVAGSGFGAPGYFRISYAADAKLLTEACHRIGEAMGRLQ